MKTFKRRSLVITLVLCLFITTFTLGKPHFIHAETLDIVPGDFASLKAALENPDRENTVIIPGGEYVFTDTVDVSKDLLIKNKDGEKVIFKLGMFNNDSNSRGKAMINVSGGTITFDGDSDENLILDGGKNLELDHSKDPIRGAGTPEGTSVSDNGVLLTLGNNTKGIINHGTFQNCVNKGALTGAIFISTGADLTMNGGRIKHNYLVWVQSASNLSIYNDANKSEARSAAIGIFGGQFTMNGGEISDNYDAFGHGPVISATGPGGNRAKVIINNGTISNNSVHSDAEEGSGRGGAIYMGVNSDITINDGNFVNNYSNGYGGVLFADWGSKVNIEGGNFSNNKSNKGGGVIATYDRFTQYNDNDPTNIGGNLNNYGIKSIDDWYNKYKLGVDLKINNGTFKENKGYMGGAVYIVSNNAEINGGNFINNEANRFGGAIYLSTLPYKMKIRNSYIYEDTADEEGISLGDQYYPQLNSAYFHLGSGGGVWNCPTGSVKLFVSNGTAIVDNKATIEGDDFTSMDKLSKGYEVDLSPRMLGGGAVEWFSDYNNKRYSASDKPLMNISNITEDLMIKSQSNEISKSAARKFAKTIFTGNRAKRGGAIGTNGHIDFGDESLEFNL